jgi:monoamine oxidase
MSRSADVIIVGAGMAGLAAAQRLAGGGKSCVLLEARDRVGGRIHTLREDNVSIELGAEFIHGRHPALWELIRQADAPIYEMDGAMLCFDGSKLGPCGDDQKNALDALEHLPNSSERDLPFVEFLKSVKLPDSQRRRVISYVEGFNAADASLISTASLARQQQAEDSIDGWSGYKLTHGYNSLTDFLADSCISAGVEMRLGAEVMGIRWRAGVVTVKLRDGSVVEADKAIITLPLAVLQQRRVIFNPVPEEIFAAADKMVMGAARRLVLRFRTAFWRELPVKGADKMHFLFSGGSATGKEPFNAWWTPNPDPTPLLTGWIGGPRAQTPATQDTLLDAGLVALARYFSMTEMALREQLVSSHTWDWSTDPFSLGAYSYVGVGGMDAPARLATPVEDTLFFAGEHTDLEGHWGTVHAALVSGHRAAGQMLGML